MRKRGEGPWIVKREALKLLATHGPVTVGGFAVLLRGAGFRVPGPRKSYNVLGRLLKQGLARRTEEVRTIRYVTRSLRNPDEPMERRQRFVLWDITPKGRDKLRELRAVKEGA